MVKVQFHRGTYLKFISSYCKVFCERFFFRAIGMGEVSNSNVICVKFSFVGRGGGQR